MTDHLMELADATTSKSIKVDAPLIIEVSSADGAGFELLGVVPTQSWHRLLYWMPAMGVPARHYLPLARALAERGIAVILHEWRGIGSSTLRAGRQQDWGYRELLRHDIAAGMLVSRQRWPQASCWMGGHSLGGQLGLLYASLRPHEVAGLLLVASGAPYWRRFRHGWLLRVSLQLAPLLADLLGYMPGRRLRFAGNEARGVIADWARSGRSGRYAVSGMSEDLERHLGMLQLPTLALRLRDDWLGPAGSLDWLLGKLQSAPCTQQLLAPKDLDGHPADHFSWMKNPEPIAARLAVWIDTQNDAFAVREDPVA